MAPFYVLGGGAAVAALAVALAPDRRCAALGLLCALASLAGLHLLLGAYGLCALELAGCIGGLIALRSDLGPLGGTAVGALVCAAAVGFVVGRGGAEPVPPLRYLWLVGALGLGGLGAALGPGQRRLLIGTQVLLGSAAAHCLALSRHVHREGARVTVFVAVLLFGQLLLGAALLSGDRRER